MEKEISREEKREDTTATGSLGELKDVSPKRNKTQKKKNAGTDDAAKTAEASTKKPSTTINEEQLVDVAATVNGEGNASIKKKKKSNSYESKTQRVKKHEMAVRTASAPPSDASVSEERSLLPPSRVRPSSKRRQPEETGQPMPQPHIQPPNHPVVGKRHANKSSHRNTENVGSRIDAIHSRRQQMGTVGRRTHPREQNSPNENRIHALSSQANKPSPAMAGTNRRLHSRNGNEASAIATGASIGSKSRPWVTPSRSAGTNLRPDRAPTKQSRYYDSMAVKGGRSRILVGNGALTTAHRSVGATNPPSMTKNLPDNAFTGAARSLPTENPVSTIATSLRAANLPSSESSSPDGNGSPRRKRSIRSSYRESMAKGAYPGVRVGTGAATKDAPVASIESSKTAVLAGTSNSQSARTSSMQSRYHEAMATKGRHPLGRDGSAPALANGGNVSRNVTSTPAISSSGAKQGKIPSRRSTFNESMTAKGGRTRPRGESKTSAGDGVTHPTATSLPRNQSAGSTRSLLSESLLAATTPPSLARDDYLQTVQPGAVAMPPDSYDIAFGSTPQMDAPDSSVEAGTNASTESTEEGNRSSAPAVAAAPAASAPPRARPRVSETEATAISAHLVEETEDHVARRFNERLEEEQNNIVTASIVQGNRSPRPIRASPYKILFLYCVAVLIPVALAGVVVGVVVGGRGRSASVPSGGEALTATPATAPTRAPTQTAEDAYTPVSASSPSPREPLPLSSQPTLSNDPGTRAPAASSPTSSTEMDSRCTSGLYYFSAMDDGWDLAGRQKLWVVDVVADLSTPEYVVTLDCDLNYFSFDRNGTAYGVCPQGIDILEDRSEILVTVDLQSGSTTGIVTSPDIDKWLAYNPVDDYLYSARYNSNGPFVGFDSPVKIDKNHGIVTVMDSSLDSIYERVSFDPNGNAYAADLWYLYFVNLAGPGTGIAPLAPGTVPDNGSFYMLGFRGTTLYGMSLADPHQGSFFAFDVTETNFTTTRTTYFENFLELDLLGGAFCPF